MTGKLKFIMIKWDLLKKVSLTLSEDEWEWLEENENGNRSNFSREIVQKEIERC